MIGVYDLYDLYLIYALIRADPKAEWNASILARVGDVLRGRQEDNAEPNALRKALRSVEILRHVEPYRFLWTENDYTYFPLSWLKDENIYSALFKANECLAEAVREGNAAKIYDLADCLHNLPIFLTENHYTFPKSYWRGEVRQYRRKWDSDFLRAEQKTLRHKRRGIQ